MSKNLPKARVLGSPAAQGLARIKGLVARLDWAYVAGGFLCAGLVVFLVGAIYWACGHDRAQAKVERVAWEHETDLRERRMYRDGDWGDAPSRTGYYREPTWDRDCHSKFHHMQCTSTGKTSVCIPVYRTWCDYSYYDWPIIDQKIVQGEGHETSWATFGSRLDDNHRETNAATYTIYFAHPDGRHWTYVTRSDSDYMQFEVGDAWELDLPHAGSMRPLRRAQLEAPAP